MEEEQEILFIQKKINGFKFILLYYKCIYMQFIYYKPLSLSRGNIPNSTCRVYYIMVNITVTRCSNTPYLHYKPYLILPGSLVPLGEREGVMLLMELSEFPLNRVKTDTILEETFSWGIKGFLSLFQLWCLLSKIVKHSPWNGDP